MRQSAHKALRHDELGETFHQGTPFDVLAKDRLLFDLRVKIRQRDGYRTNVLGQFERLCRPCLSLQRKSIANLGFDTAALRTACLEQFTVAGLVQYVLNDADIDFQLIGQLRSEFYATHVHRLEHESQKAVRGYSSFGNRRWGHGYYRGRLRRRLQQGIMNHGILEA